MKICIKTKYVEKDLTAAARRDGVQQAVYQQQHLKSLVHYVLSHKGSLVSCTRLS